MALLSQVGVVGGCSIFEVENAFDHRLQLDIDSTFATKTSHNATNGTEPEKSIVKVLVATENQFCIHRGVGATTKITKLTQPQTLKENNFRLGII